MPSETMMQRLKLLWTELKPLSPFSAFLTLVLIPLSADFSLSLIFHFPSGVRADSGVLPEWEASLCREPEQRWRLYAWCGAQEDHDGSWWFWEHQEAQTVHAPTVPQGVCVFSIFVHLWVNDTHTSHPGSFFPFSVCTTHLWNWKGPIHSWNCWDPWLNQANNHWKLFVND